MRCVRCEAPGTSVAQVEKYGARIRRRRECPVCGHRFTTDERPRVGGIELGRPTLELAAAYNRGEALHRAVEDQATAHQVRQVARALRAEGAAYAHLRDDSGPDDHELARQRQRLYQGREA